MPWASNVGPKRTWAWQWSWVYNARMMVSGRQNMLPLTPCWAINSMLGQINFCLNHLEKNDHLKPTSRRCLSPTSRHALSSSSRRPLGMPVPRLLEPPTSPNPVSLGYALTWTLTWLRYLSKGWPIGPPGESACLDHPCGTLLGMPGPAPITQHPLL